MLSSANCLRKVSEFKILERLTVAVLQYNLNVPDPAEFCVGVNDVSVHPMFRLADQIDLGVVTFSKSLAWSDILHLVFWGPLSPPKVEAKNSFVYLAWGNTQFG